MSVYRRGETWWYRFKFAGQSIRESAKTASKTVAKEAEKARRRELERGFNNITARKQAPLFSAAAKEWFAEKNGLAAKTVSGYQQRLVSAVKAFGQRLVCDISVTDVVEYRAARLDAGAANRTVNYEVGCIRGVLKRHGLWAPIAERIKRLRENHDVGRALSPEDEPRLLAACRDSKAPSLLPLFIFARDTGLRAAETKALRRRDLRLSWHNGVIASGEVIVPKSKTEAGIGRGVPFSPDVCSTLTLWLAHFPKATADSYVFPRHEVQMLKGGSETRICNVMLNKPVQSWQRAWRTAQKQASAAKLDDLLRGQGADEQSRQERVAALKASAAMSIPTDCSVKYRWHDLRHTFITHLAENRNVSEQTIRALAGHVSKQMLERYSHIRTQAKQDAIAALHSTRVVFAAEGAQKWAQSAEQEKQGKRVTH